MALYSVFLAYLFLKFDHNNQENIVIKILAPHEGLPGLSPIIIYQASWPAGNCKAGEFPGRTSFVYKF